MQNYVPFFTSNFTVQILFRFNKKLTDNSFVDKTSSFQELPKNCLQIKILIFYFLLKLVQIGHGFTWCTVIVC